MSKSKRRKPLPMQRPSVAVSATSRVSPSVIDVPSVPQPTGRASDLWLAGAILGALFFWAFWPQLASLVDVWNDEPDYSHGYLVPVIAGLFLWFRRDHFPGPQRVPQWGGLLVLAVSLCAVSRR